MTYKTILEALIYNLEAAILETAFTQFTIKPAKSWSE